MAIQLKMPSLSPTMEEGTIVKWMKAEGEPMEVDEEGVLVKIIKSADSGAIKVGELIAIVAEDGEDWKDVAASAGKAPPAPSKSVPAPTVETGGSTPGTVINMPSLSPTMTEGTLVKWYKKEGETITAGDVLCDIQTDKAVVSMEFDDDGVVAKIIMPEGSSGVQVGTLIALMVEEGQDWKDVTIPAAESEGSAAVSKCPEATPSSPAPPSSSEYTHPAQTGPAAALLLSQYGLDPSAIEGSGPKGNLTKADVLKYIKTNALSTPTPPQVPLPGVAKPVVSVTPPPTPAPAPRPSA